MLLRRLLLVLLPPRCPPRPVFTLILLSLCSCGALTSGAVSFAGNTHNGVNNKYIETKDLDGVAGQSFSVCMDVKKAEDGTEQLLFSMGQATTGELSGEFL